MSRIFKCVIRFLHSKLMCGILMVLELQMCIKGNILKVLLVTRVKEKLRGKKQREHGKST